MRGSWNSVAYGNGVYIAVNGWGSVARSTDGGRTFAEVLNTGWAMSDVEYGFNGTGMAFWTTGKGSQDFLYESTDGGQTWTDIAGDFSFFANEGGHDIVLSPDGNLIYTRISANNNFGDAFYYDGSYYIFGGGPESSVHRSPDGESYEVAVANSGQWLLGGIVVGEQALIYGSLFETPGDFGTRRGAIYALTNDPTSPVNPTPIETGINSYVSDMDRDPAQSSILYATGANALLTSTDSGSTWTIDTLAEGTSIFDMAEMAIGEEERVAVGGSGIVFLSKADGGGNPDEWGGYAIVDGYVNTEAWMGWLYIEQSPWVITLNLGRWIYLSEPPRDATGSWIYVPR